MDVLGLCDAGQQPAGRVKVASPTITVNRPGTILSYRGSRITSETTSMSVQTAATCEVKVGGAWQAVTLKEAHAKHGGTDKRCPACHGRVIVSGSYSGPFKLILSHRKNHQGCPLTPKLFQGEAWPHPEALV